MIERPWIRLGLRALQAFLVLFAVYFVVNMKLSHDQRKAVSRVRELGGTVTYDYQVFRGRLIEQAPAPSPRWLRSSYGDDFLSSVVWVNLGLSDVQDDDLAALKCLSELDVLTLYRTNISDAGLVHLRPFRKLRHLNLAGTQISDDGLTTLATLPQLALLNLRETKISDAAIARLKERLPQCEVLR